jgi:DNA-binding CsgD family transcriptional regulator
MSGTKKTQKRRPELLENTVQHGLSFLEQALLGVKAPKQPKPKPLPVAKTTNRVAKWIQATDPTPSLTPKEQARPAKSSHTRPEKLAPYEEAICKAYNENATLRDLAARYDTTVVMIRRVLVKHKIPMRPVGRISGKPSAAYDQLIKVTPKQRDWILEEDLKGTEHTVLAEKLGISKERVRQICLKAGHPSRRQVQRVQREQQAITDESEKIKRYVERREQVMTITPVMEKAAAMWAQGKTVHIIAKTLKISPNSMGVHISRWRGRHPKLFPRRYAQKVSE